MKGLIRGVEVQCHLVGNLARRFSRDKEGLETEDQRSLLILEYLTVSCSQSLDASSRRSAFHLTHTQASEAGRLGRQQQG